MSPRRAAPSSALSHFPLLRVSALISLPRAFISDVLSRQNEPHFITGRVGSDTWSDSCTSFPGHGRDVRSRRGDGVSPGGHALLRASPPHVLGSRPRAGHAPTLCSGPRWEGDVVEKADRGDVCAVHRRAWPTAGFSRPADTVTVPRTKREAGELRVADISKPLLQDSLDASDSVVWT